MSSSDAGEFDNSEYQKQLAKTLLKQVNNQPDVARTPEEIYEEFFEPIPGPCTQELIEYLVERMVQHDDGIVERCDNYSDRIRIRRSRVGEYIKVHLDTDGDPFPEVDPTPFQEQSS